MEIIDNKEMTKASRAAKNIFLYSVAGRSSSTALQRILNSSGEVFIYGESWSVNSKMLQLIYKMMGIVGDDEKMARASRHIEAIRKQFDGGELTEKEAFYPNAFPISDNFLEDMCNQFADLYQAPFGTTGRTGYKDIRVGGLGELRALRKIYPNSVFVFVFRDPIKQYVSVKSVNYWAYSKKVKLFVELYIKFANVYLNYLKEDPNCILIENTFLKDPAKVRSLLDRLEIGSVSDKMISRKVRSTRKENLTETEKKILGDADLAKAYKQLKSMAVKNIKPSNKG